MKKLLNEDQDQSTYQALDRDENPVKLTTRYFHTRKEFDEAVARDFILHANIGTEDGSRFLVGLAHGMSPSGAYAFILDHFNMIKRPELLDFTFTNSRLMRQRDLDHSIMDSAGFLKQMIKQGLITKDQVLGRSFRRELIEEYADYYNAKMSGYLKSNGKTGYDYVFLATDPGGRVAAVSYHSKAFESDAIMTVVNDRAEKELTVTPKFILQAKRVAFLATKADKRRSLAWLYSVWGAPNESPSFLRFMEDVEKRMIVFIDDKALTWPQIELQREGKYGVSTIRIDVAKPFNENAVRKLPVILFVHGFLGLNSFDGLLTILPSHKYIAAALHYGSIPDDLPPRRYSAHVMRNINHAIKYFGELGHPVYLFDHSMGNIYFMMMDRHFDELDGVNKYLRGRIGANPFFGEEAKHALEGFLDYVIIPSLSLFKNPGEKTAMIAFRQLLPLDTKRSVRRRGINLTSVLINRDSRERDLIWKAAKDRILEMMSNMDSLPALNKIPIGKALNRLPAKIFAIQVHSALIESKEFDRQKGLVNMGKHNIPVLIIKSERDGVAKYVPRLYEEPYASVKDVTHWKEKNLFREHLYHMVAPVEIATIIEEFIETTEKEVGAKLTGRPT